MGSPGARVPVVMPEKQHARDLFICALETSWAEPCFDGAG